MEAAMEITAMGKRQSTRARLREAPERTRGTRTRTPTLTWTKTKTKTPMRTWMTTRTIRTSKRRLWGFPFCGRTRWTCLSKTPTPGSRFSSRGFRKELRNLPRSPRRRLSRRPPRRNPKQNQPAGRPTTPRFPIHNQRPLPGTGMTGTARPTKTALGRLTCFATRCFSDSWRTTRRPTRTGRGFSQTCWNSPESPRRFARRGRSSSSTRMAVPTLNSRKARSRELLKKARSLALLNEA
mmetsp:Transcript_12187/g.40477  ORF Transcript_12187/g.40477 Transcript_12187/m.40477 type:complete len:238 (-) Transcript_12187:941-1654(-)